MRDMRIKSQGGDAPRQNAKGPETQGLERGLHDGQGPEKTNPSLPGLPHEETQR